MNLDLRVWVPMSVVFVTLDLRTNDQAVSRSQNPGLVAV